MSRLVRVVLMRLLSLYLLEVTLTIALLSLKLVGLLMLSETSHNALDRWKKSPAADIFNTFRSKTHTKFKRTSSVLSLRQKTTTKWESTPNTCLFIHLKLKYKKGMHKEVPILLARVSSQFLSSSHYVEQKWAKQSNAASDTWRSENETWYPGTTAVHWKSNFNSSKLKHSIPWRNQYEE